jgi:hypothetical protein
VGHDKVLSISDEIFYKFSALGIPDGRAQRNRQDEVWRAAPFLILTFSVLTSLGVVMLLVTEIEKRGKLAIGL